MIALLDGIVAHLQATHPYVDVGRKRPDTPSTAPWCAVALTNAAPDGNTVAAGDLDVAQDSMVHLRCVGSSSAQLGLFLDALETRMRTSFTVQGRVVQLVIHDRTQGPERDLSVDPDPAVWIAHSYWTVQHAPNPS